MSNRTSARKRRANRLNAQRSTGPRTREGKARSSRNATTHGLFCNDLVLPGEDQNTFHVIREGFLDRFNPQDLVELMLVDRIVAASWKLRRLQQAEWMMHESDADRIKDDAMRELQAGNHGFEPDELMELNQVLQKQSLPPASTFMAARMGKNDQIEKLNRMEQRLEHSIHRSINQLRKLRKEQREQDEQLPLPRCPYLASTQPIAEPAEAADPSDGQPSTSNTRQSNSQNEPTAPPADAQANVPPMVTLPRESVTEDQLPDGYHDAPSEARNPSAIGRMAPHTSARTQ